MILQIQPYSWACLATAFAMALDIPVREFFEIAGHDGGAIAFDWLPEPLCRRGFHINEAIYVAMQAGYSATPLDLCPAIAATNRPHEVIQVSSLGSRTTCSVFERILMDSSGVIECRTPGGNWHAVAFANGMIFDPNGREFVYTQLGCEQRGLYTNRLWKVQYVSHE